MWSTFKASLQGTFSEQDIDLLIEALQTAPMVSVRLHPLKPITTLPWDTSQVTWCPLGAYLSQRPIFGTDPYFHAGAYYVQDASSMWLWQIKPFLEQLSIRANTSGPFSDCLKVLDACASPGGKSTLLLDILPKKSLLVSNEIIRSRVPALAENIAKWGYSNVMVTQNDPADFGQWPGLFDLIVADVPCSGEGMFRKDVAAREEWSPAHVELCAARQRRILSDLWPALRPGGILVYSTCTFNRKEDEEQVDWLSHHFGASQVMESRKFLPHITRGEGFFMAVVQKPDTAALTSTGRLPHGKINSERISASAPKPLQGDYAYLMKGDLLKAVPTSLFPLMQTLATKLKAAHYGIAVAQQKGADWIPHADLALAVDLRKDAFETYDLTPEQTLAFLRRDGFSLPLGTKKGHLLVSYQSHPLGFIKNLGNRINNLYPPSRRIYSR